MLMHPSIFDVLARAITPGCSGVPFMRCCQACARDFRKCVFTGMPFLLTNATRSAEPQKPATPALRAPAITWGQARSPRWHRASHYGPSQVVPGPLEESQQPDSSRPLLEAQQGQQSAQPTPSLARSVFSRVAVIGNRRCQAELQQRSAAGSAARQEEPKAALLGTSTCAVPSQPQPEALERQESPTEAASRGMAAASGSKGGDGPSSAILTRRGSRWVACLALHLCWAPLRYCALP